MSRFKKDKFIELSDTFYITWMGHFHMFWLRPQAVLGYVDDVR
ncbi:MAG: hypothetical protein DDT26_01727 [Dehalococcoidia bacterium]|nr:hypothetical protein [Chloroflexota bacterium]